MSQRISSVLAHRILDGGRPSGIDEVLRGGRWRSEMPNEMQDGGPFPALKFFEINAFVISLMQGFHS